MTLVGRCMGCFHDFRTGPCGGCGAVQGPHDNALATGWVAGDPCLACGSRDTGWDHELGGFCNDCHAADSDE